MSAKFAVRLSSEERAELESVLRKQNVAAAVSRRARVLLLADEAHLDGRRPDKYIEEVVGISERQVRRIRQNFTLRGLKQSVGRKPRETPPTPPKLDGAAEAQLVALCCSTPPEGRQRWTLQLLVDELCRLEVVASVCTETIRKCLKKTGYSLGGPNGSVSRKKTVFGSSPTWSESSMSTRSLLTTGTR